MQRDNYEVRSLNLKQDGQVPEDAAILIVAGPKRDLDSDEMDAIMDYLIRGGKMVILLDPDAPDTYRQVLAEWGLLIGKDPIADLISNVAGEAKSPMAQKSNAQFVSSGLTGVPIVDQLNVVFFTDATAVQPIIPIGDLPPYMTYGSLTHTTPASWLETHPEEVNYDPGDDLQGPFRRWGGHPGGRHPDRPAGHHARYRSQDRGVRGFGLRQEQVLLQQR